MPSLMQENLFLTHFESHSQSFNIPANAAKAKMAITRKYKKLLHFEKQAARTKAGWLQLLQ